MYAAHVVFPDLISPSQQLWDRGRSGEQGQKLNSEERCDVPNMAQRRVSGAKTLPSDMHVWSLLGALYWD